MLIQWILILVLFAALIVTRRRVRQKAIRPIEGTVWSLVWIGTGFVILQPEILNRLADLVGVGRGADLVLYAAIIILLLLVFHLHVAHDRLERELTELVRREALRDIDHLNLT